tara:strand:- start:1492 stop:2424 length:933 start_codon:yes stop_codon:yes gene_type:complete
VNYNPILIVPGEPKSIFFEIFFKSVKLSKIISPLILICNKKVLYQEIKRFNFKLEIKELDKNALNKKIIKKKKIYFVDISNKIAKIYIQKCFDFAFSLLKKGFTNKIINGPINKAKTLDKKYLGVTEYISHSFNQKKFAMLIYNKNLSVCPVTTHLPISQITKKINKKLIIEKIIIVNNFYKKFLGFKPKIAVTGLNPHCESVLGYNEDEKIILPAVKFLKKKINVKGPFPADTIFLKDNRKKFDVIIGMYHDQVLGPIKTLVEYDAINITLGLPFLRVTPDHGPNEKMVGKNKSNPISLIKAFNFLDQR